MPSVVLPCPALPGAAGKFCGAFDGDGVWQSLHGAFASGGLIAPVSASFQIRHPRPYHGPLVVRVMSAVVIQASDKAKRIVPALRRFAASLRSLDVQICTC